MSKGWQRFVLVSAPLYAALALLSFRGVVFKGGAEITARSIWMHEYDYVLQWLYVCLGLTLSAAWVWSVACFDELGADTRVVFGVGALLGLLSVAAYPGVNSNDILAYVGYGRMLAVHHQNPWMHGYGVVDDFYTPYAWYPFPMPYGPVVAPFLAVAGTISSVSVPLSYYFLKACWLAVHLGSGWLVLDIARRVGAPSHDRLTPLAAAWTFLTCPLLLVELLNNGHCDGLLVMFALASVRALLARDDEVGGLQALIFTLLAILVKPTALLLAAAEAAWLARRRRWAALVGGAVIALGAVFVLSQTIFSSPEARASLTNPHILTNAHSVHSIFIHAARPPLPGETRAEYLFEYEAPHYAGVRAAIGGAFALFCLWRMACVRTREDVIREYLWMTLALMLFYSARVWPWYVSWLLPFAVVVDLRPLRRMIIAWCVTMFGIYAMPFALLWRSLGWHVARVLVTTGVPVAVGLADAWWSERVTEPTSTEVFTSPPPAGI